MVMEQDMVIQKFYEALDTLGIDYNEETGRLSSPIEFIIYKAHRRLEAKRVLIFKTFFLIIDEDKSDTRKLNFQNVHGFKSPDNIVGL